MKYGLLSIPLSCMISLTCHAQGCDNLFGTWTSGSGSTLILQTDPTDNNGLLGSFKSPDGLFPDNVAFPLYGSFGTNTFDLPSKGTAISFRVNWTKEEGSISSWTGACLTTSKGPKLDLLWHQANPAATKSIFHINSGSSIFYPAPE
ncbi:hypothetical protein EOPP23_19400 [Endozoicomonas sp. OPT23]|uniref:avidin/streptavidin family protein n=1 Tax=Endozoicomonas sp. OPT23 TaxID=2072845 RepID=UPI00129BD19C|nr:avidin/streptavidin family protein [Endozoicomonas sp. OPT23]MRI35136.1 hypothetical protein [Endozoicomonas sp. OPT23]